MVEAVAKFDFTGRSPEELSIKRGDFLRILKTKSHLETYWYFGELNGRVGLVPENHIQMRPYSWFFESMSRKDSEHFLEDKETGNFLIRHAESSPTLGSYSLSVKYDEKVKHFKICRHTDGYFFIWQRKFKSLNDLVEFHSIHSISSSQNVQLVELAPEFLPTPEYQEDIEYNPHLVKSQETGTGTGTGTADGEVAPTRRSTSSDNVLDIPISLLSLANNDKNNSLLQHHFENSGSENDKWDSTKTETQTKIKEAKSLPGPPGPQTRPASAPSPESPKLNLAKNPIIFVKALYDFNAEEKDELAFKAGQVIRVTNMDHEHWWQGNVRDQTGQFPSSHVIIFEP